jgi:uncharacterized ferritin-like protein (DUF455 family)
MERMKACGIEFGSIPVSGYFWRAVSGMESPMDYVAGLSLTFEQANLDFARHFSACFAEVGDADSAKLLQKIYRDEIGHVAYGLKWFRRWKNPSESDWEAFCRQLKFPLVSRAGQRFFHQCRRPARGRPPAGFHREPECLLTVERAHANGVCLQSADRSAHRRWQKLFPQANIKPNSSAI